MDGASEGKSGHLICNLSAKGRRDGRLPDAIQISSRFHIITLHSVPWNLKHKKRFTGFGSKCVVGMLSLDRLHLSSGVTFACCKSKTFCMSVRVKRLRSLVRRGEEIRRVGNPAKRYFSSPGRARATRGGREGRRGLRSRKR